MSATSWFTVDKVSENTHIISEYRHPEETHCYLLCGEERTLLIDTGLGIGNIYDAVRRLTDNPISAVATHIHWDHIGGHRYFSEFFAHSEELDWLSGAFPLPIAAIRKMLTKGCDLPEGYNPLSYELFQGNPSRLLKDGDEIDLGGRTIKVLHTPGHSPGHICFYEEASGFLFTGDLIYKGTLFANYPSTDPKAYFDSVKRLAKIPAKRIFPGHHSLDIEPELVQKVYLGLEKMQKEGKLCHGSRKYAFGDWAIMF